MHSYPIDVGFSCENYELVTLQLTFRLESLLKQPVYNGCTFVSIKKMLTSQLLGMAPSERGIKTHCPLRNTAPGGLLALVVQT